MISNQDLKKKALDGLANNWGKGVGSGILLYVIIIFIALVLHVFILLLTYPLEEDLALLITMGIVYIICYTFFMPLFVGTSWMYLHLVRQEHAPISLMFTTFRFFPKLFTTGLLKMILVALWSLLLIIPGILRYYSYSQTIYILKDEPDLSAMEAINESKRRMEGKRGKLFLMQLSFIGWYLLGSFTTFSHLWSYPYYKTTRAGFYESYIKRENLIEAEVQSR